MTANLIGFAVGVDGMTEMMSQLFKWDGIWFNDRSMVCSEYLYRVIHRCTLYVL
jgi:hypothetical protein